MGLSETLKTYEKLANQEIDLLLAEELNPQSVHEHLMNYIRYRFMLVDEAFESDDISELSEFSLKKMLKLQRDEDLDEISLTCTGVSSKSRKKVLLMLALGKKLGFKWDPAESASIETVTQLTDAVIAHLQSA